MNHANNQQGSRESPPKRRTRGLSRLVFGLSGIALGLLLAVLFLQRSPPPDVPPVERHTATPKSAAMPSIPFTDIASSSGIHTVHRNGAAGQKLLPETMGGGCAFFDYDQDGDPDMLLLSGQPWPWDESPQQPASSSLALYRNDNGSFTEVTTAMGLKASFYAEGVAVGDYDADGDDDLFVTAVGNNRLYRNDGDRFTDVTAETGLAGDADGWTTSAGFFDYDEDGDLDLFVCSYIRWSREIDLTTDYRLVGVGRSYGPPFNFQGSQSCLYRNDGGHFTDVSESAGIHVTNESTGQPEGKALAVTFLDVDRDGRLDILVANDTVRNFLFHNRGDGTFEEQGQYYGFAYDSNGGATGAMGIDAGWFRNNDELAVAIGNFANEMTSLYVTQGANALFTDEALAAGVGGPTRRALTFGLLMEDFDLDGRVDLVQTNGHLEEKINLVEASQNYRQPAQLFWNAGLAARHQFVEVPPNEIGDLAKLVVGRGLASADIDQDGDVDLLLTQVNGPPILLRNDQQRGRNWLRCRLAGLPGNPHGIGAVVELVSGDVAQHRIVMPTRSYLSQSEPIITFGLGEHTRIDRLKVIWPDGATQELRPDSVNQVVTISRDAESFAALANKGKALLENGRFEQSVEMLQKALALRPRSVPTRRNLARAYLLGGQMDAAREQLLLLEEQANEPSAANAYLLGIVAMRQSNYDEAEQYLARALKTAPNVATVHFQLATSLLALGRNDEAQLQFEKTVELDPLHSGAQFQLASFARKAGDHAAFSRYMRDYERIRAIKGETETDTILLEACTFTKAEDAIKSRAAESKPVMSNLKFVAAEPGDDSPGGFIELAAAAVLAMDPSEQYQLVGVDLNGELLVLQCDSSGNLQELARADVPLTSDPEGVTVLVGNAIVDSQSQNAEADDWPEIAVVSPQQSWLFRYNIAEGFEDLTSRSNLSTAAGQTACWVDLEHDGDIDLCTCSLSGIRAWRNDGDGTFIDATDEFGLSPSISGTDFVAVDLDEANLNVDLIVTGPDRSMLWRSQYAGRFTSDDTTSASWPAATRVIADDFDNDGAPEIVFLLPASLTLCTARGEAAQTLPLPFEQIGAATTLDADNDGWLDLAISGRTGSQGQVILLHNIGGQFQQTADPVPAAAARRSGLLDLDIDGDGDTDLLLLGEGGSPILLRNETPTKNHQLKLALHSYVGQPSSIGVRVQVRCEDFVASRWTQREIPIEIGVGQRSQIDSIQTLWGNGVVNNQIEVAVSDHPVQILIFELVRTGSCPFLYAWVDGAWQFVTDLLGTAPLNVSVAREVTLPPDPDELVVLGPLEDFNDGKVRLQVTSEMREAIYLDQLRLICVDHPLQTTVFSRDRLALSRVEGPQIALGRDEIQLRAAVGSDGIDRTHALKMRDNQFAATGARIPQVIGVTEPLTITMDFGELADDNLLLALTGWLRFGSSSNNIAVSQRSGVLELWPELEAAGEDGIWQLVDDRVGLPTGNPKTIVCDLAGKLPPHTHQLRLTTSFEVYWDQVALYRKVSVDQATMMPLKLIRADLDWHGFAELRSPAFGHPEVPNLARISNAPPWFTSVQGWCTRYGPVDRLVNEADERMAIMNSGDGTTLEFSPESLPPLAAATSRTLTIFSHGWIKEGDPNSYPDLQIAPFPGSGGPLEQDDWQLEYNTRWVPWNRFQRKGQPQ